MLVLTEIVFAFLTSKTSEYIVKILIQGAAWKSAAPLHYKAKYKKLPPNFTCDISAERWYQDMQASICA
jgi:hypothetical protein